MGFGGNALGSVKLSRFERWDQGEIGVDPRGAHMQNHPVVLHMCCLLTPEAQLTCQRRSLTIALQQC